MNIVAHSRVLAVVTIVMSLSLLLSYGVNRDSFPEGRVFAFVYFWVLLSVWIVPVLLIAELVVVVRLVSIDLVNRQSLLIWNVLALLVGLMVGLVMVTFPV